MSANYTGEHAFGWLTFDFPSTRTQIDFNPPHSSTGSFGNMPRSQATARSESHLPTESCFKLLWALSYTSHLRTQHQNNMPELRILPNEGQAGPFFSHVPRMLPADLTNPSTPIPRARVIEPLLGIGPLGPPMFWGVFAPVWESGTLVGPPTFTRLLSAPLLKV